MSKASGSAARSKRFSFFVHFFANLATNAGISLRTARPKRPPVCFASKNSEAVSRL